MLPAIAIGCRWWVVEDREGSVKSQVKSQLREKLFTFDELGVGGGPCS
jgi:hypothetical protein